MSAQSAEPGSREAAVELLDGITQTIAIEADESDDEYMSWRLANLLADVMDAADDLDC